MIVRAQEIADRLGVAVHRVYQWCRADRMPHIPGGHNRHGRKTGKRPWYAFDLDEVLNWWNGEV